MTTARKLWKFYQDGRLRFTHTLIDEAAQALEPECVTPLVMADEHTKIVLAGDHMQVASHNYFEKTGNHKYRAFDRQFGLMTLMPKRVIVNALSKVVNFLWVLLTGDVERLVVIVKINIVKFCKPLPFES